MSNESIVWENGEEGIWPYHVYGLTRTNEGTILAFAEARVSAGDEAPHHIVSKRSIDGGLTWSDNCYIERSDGAYWNANGFPGKSEAWGNPTPVVESEGGRVFVFYALNEGSRHQNATQVFYRFSDDDGLTWHPTTKAGRRVEVTRLLVGNGRGWTFHLPGPGHGIQLRRQSESDSNGRLIVPIWHRRAVTEFPRLYGVSLLVSDDKGSTWRHTGETGVSRGMGEGRLLELGDAQLLLNARGGKAVDSQCQIDTERWRVFAWSTDGGETIGPPVVRREFVFSYNGCDSGWEWVASGPAGGDGRALFSRPADPDARARMTVSGSVDGGKTWVFSKTIDDGPAYYSDLVDLRDGTVGLLYGKGAGHTHLPDRVAFRRLSLDYLENDEE